MNGSKAKKAVWLALGVLFLAAAVLRYQWADRKNSARRPPATARVADKPPLVDAHGDPLPAGAVLRLGTTRWRHRDEIRQILFSPDGKTLAAVSGGSDGDIRLWDVETGRLRHHLTGPDVSDRARTVIASMAFSPDGTKLAVNEDAGVLRLWDAVTGEEIYTFLGHEDIWVGRKFRIVFSPDGTIFASSGRDQTVRVWETETGRERYAFRMTQPNAQEVRRRRRRRRRLSRDRDRLVPAEIVFSRDGRFLAAASDYPPAIEVWNLETGETQTLIEDAHGTSLRHLAVAAEPDRLVSFGRRLIPVQTDRAERRPDYDEVPEVRFWDIHSGELVDEREQIGADYPFRAGQRMDLSQDGTTLVWADRQGLHLWNLKTNQLVRTIETPGLYGRPEVALNSDATTVAVGISNSIHLWGCGTGQRLFEELGEPSYWFGDLAYAGGGEVIVAAVNGEIRGWDAQSGRLLYRLGIREGFPHSINRLSVSPDGRLVAGIGRRDASRSERVDRVLFWDARTGELLQELPSGNSPLARPDLPTFSPDGRLLALQEHVPEELSDDGERQREAHQVYNISIWDVQSGRKTRTLELPWGPNVNRRLIGMAFSSDSSLLYTVAGSGTVRSWDLRTGRPVGEFLSDGRLWNGKPIDLGQSRVDNAVFSHDTSLLLTGSGRHVFVWDLQTTKRLKTISTPGSGRAREFAIAPDNKLVATSDTDGRDDTIRLWDVEGGRERFQWHPGDAQARNLAFSPDGTRLVTSMDRGTILVWDVTRALDQ